MTAQTASRFRFVLDGRDVTATVAAAETLAAALNIADKTMRSVTAQPGQPSRTPAHTSETLPDGTKRFRFAGHGLDVVPPAAPALDPYPVRCEAHDGLHAERADCTNPHEIIAPMPADDAHAPHAFLRSAGSASMCAVCGNGADDPRHADAARIEALRLDLAAILGYDDPHAPDLEHLGHDDLGREMYAVDNGSHFAVDFEESTTVRVTRLRTNGDAVVVYDRDAQAAAAAAVSAAGGAIGGVVYERAIAAVTRRTGGPRAMISACLRMIRDRDGGLHWTGLGTEAQRVLVDGLLDDAGHATNPNGCMTPVYDAVRAQDVTRRRIAVTVYNRDPLADLALDAGQQREAIARAIIALAGDLGVAARDVAHDLIDDVDALDVPPTADSPRTGQHRCYRCLDTGTVVETGLPGTTSAPYPCDCPAGQQAAAAVDAS